MPVSALLKPRIRRIAAGILSNSRSVHALGRIDGRSRPHSPDAKRGFDLRQVVWTWSQVRGTSCTTDADGWRMRFFFLVVLLAGLALGIGYPLAVRHVPGYEIGVFPLFDAGGYRPADVSLAPADAPVRVRLVMQVAERLVPSADRAVFRMSVTTGGQPVFEQSVTFAGLEPQAGAEADADAVYEDDLATIDPVNGDDRYVFTLEPTAGGGVSPSRVDLILNAGAFDLDPRAVPVGYVLIVVGVVGFVAMARRRRKLNRENPPPPRWGRGPDGEP